MRTAAKMTVRRRARGAAGALALAGACVAAAGLPAGASALTLPAVTEAAQTNARWRLGTLPAAISSASDPVGTTFTFALNEPLNVTLKFLRGIPGTLQRGGPLGVECRPTPAPRKLKGHKKPKRAKKGRPCTAGVAAGSLTLSGHEGLNTVAFQGVLSPTQKLRPGAYTLIIAGTDAAGAAALPAVLTFTITG